MSLVLQGASNSHRAHHTNAILGSVGIAFSAASSHRREQLREQALAQQAQQQLHGSQETLNNTAGTNLAVYKMISPAADILTRIGVDHVIIGFLSIILQILRMSKTEIFYSGCQDFFRALYASYALNLI